MYRRLLRAPRSLLARGNHRSPAPSPRSSRNRELIGLVEAKEPADRPHRQARGAAGAPGDDESREQKKEKERSAEEPPSVCSRLRGQSRASLADGEPTCRSVRGLRGCKELCIYDETLFPRSGEKRTMVPRLANKGTHIVVIRASSTNQGENRAESETSSPLSVSAPTFVVSWKSKRSQR
jgi:hypothetical protein